MPERGARETRPCAHCGTPVTRLLSQIRRPGLWFCGAACRGAYGIIPRASRGGKIQVACTECGKEIERFKSQAKLSKQPFCSNVCKARWYGRERLAAGTWVRPNKPRRGMEQPCATCGQPVYRPASAPDRPRYCSWACQHQGQRIERVEKPCEHCGILMVLHPSTAQTRRFCTKACEHAQRTKRPTGRIVNGRPVLINAMGYLTIYAPAHPAAGHNGRVLEHRIIMEQVLGRPLTREEHVHHRNGDKTDNRPENLEVLAPDEHTRVTVARTMERHRTAAEELAEYRRRFGPLTEKE